MTEKERQEKLKSLRKRLAGLHAEIAELSNRSRAVQANVREAVDICEKEIHYYENVQIDVEGIEIILQDKEGKERKFIVVEHNPDPDKNVISKRSLAGMNFLRKKAGDTVFFNFGYYKVKSRKKVKLDS